MPGDWDAHAILATEPHAVLVGNGPGDPSVLDGPIETVRGLLGRVPLFGICLGHQVLGLALGLETFKLHFGHRGANHPVRDLRSAACSSPSRITATPCPPPTPSSSRTCL